MSVQVESSGITISHANEAELQAGMAELAEVHGWRAQREVVVPGWGRLDLVLHATAHDDYAAVVEFKNELTKLSGIRKAFQQADGYQKWLLTTKGLDSRVWLSAPAIDFDIANDLAYAYRETVRLVSAGNVMGFITGRYSIATRIARARARHEITARAYRLSTHAHNGLVEMSRDLPRRIAPVPSTV